MPPLFCPDRLPPGPLRPAASRCAPTAVGAARRAAAAWATLWATLLPGLPVVRAHDDLAAAAVAPSPSATGEEPASTAPVDFQRDVEPLLRRSCLPCHNKSAAEAEVVLEPPQALLAAAADPLVAPGDPLASRLFRLAAGIDEPAMPPADNAVQAPRLTAAEVRVLERWIGHGAEIAAPTPGPPAIAWRPLRSERQPIRAARFAAFDTLCLTAQGNQLASHDLLGDAPPEMLVDPQVAAAGPGFREAAHLDAIGALAVSADGQQAASGGFRHVKLWRRTRLAERLDLPLGEPPAACVLDAASGWLAAGDAAGRLTLARDPAAGHADSRRTWQAHDASIVAIRFTADRRHVVSFAADGAVRRWSVPGGILGNAWQLAAGVRAAALVADDVAATAADDPVIRVWRLADAPPSAAAAGAADAPPAAAPLVPERELRGHGRRATCLAPIPGVPNGLLSGGLDGFVRRWDASTGAELERWIHGAGVVALAARPDGSAVAAAGDDGFVRAWPFGGEEPLWSGRADLFAAQRLGRAVEEVALAESRQAAAIAARTAAARQLETDAARLAAARQHRAEADGQLEEKRCQLAEARHRHDAAVAADPAADAGALAAQVAAAREAADAAERAQRDAEAALRRAEEGELFSRGGVAAAQARLAAAQGELDECRVGADRIADACVRLPPPAEIAYATDGGELLVADRSGAVFVRDGARGTPLDAWQAAGEIVAGAAGFAAGGRILVADSQTPAGWIAWPRRASWTLAQRIGDPSDPQSVLGGSVHALDFSPDGRRLAIGGGDASRVGQLVVWDLPQQRPIAIGAAPHRDVILGVAYSRDGQFLATASADRDVKVFRAGDATLVKTFEGHTHYVLGVAWRADGLQLASSGADKTVKVWDFHAGEQLRAVAGFGKEATSIAYLGTGSQFAAAGGDRALRIGNADDGAVVRTVPVGADYLFCCAVSSGGDLVAIGGAERVLRVVQAGDGQERYRFPPAPAAP